MLHLLPFIYWFAGFGLIMHGILTLDSGSTWSGLGLFVLAMVMVAYLIFGEAE